MQDAAAGVLELTERGMANKARSCARLRAALGDVPGDVLLVPWNSAMRSLSVRVCQGIIGYIQRGDNAVFSAHPALVADMRSVLPGSSSAPTDGNGSAPAGGIGYVADALGLCLSRHLVWLFLLSSIACPPLLSLDAS